MKLNAKFSLFSIFIISSFILKSTLAETPVNCSYEDIRGKWLFHEGPRGNDKSINCTSNCKLILLQLFNDQ